MKIYKYWQIETGKGYIGQEEIEIRCYGGSNLSEEDARVKAHEKIEKVRRKLAGDKHAFDSYDVEIREEIVQALDENAVITRNRYGAQVLNVQDLMIMDIDQPKSSFLDLFRRRDESANKQKIVAMVRKLSQKPAYQGYGFRVYETKKGIRVIVLGKTFDPQADATSAMMKEFHCDALYTLLCKRQGCFRARLTPKPSRMKVRGYRVKFPRSAEDEREFQAWLVDYEAASRNYSVCKWVEQIGPGYAPEAVRVHDEISGVNRHQSLA